MKLVSFLAAALVLAKVIWASEDDGYSTYCSVPDPNSSAPSSAPVGCYPSESTDYAFPYDVDEYYRPPAPIYNAFTGNRERLWAQISNLPVQKIISQMQENTYHFSKRQKDFDAQIRLLQETKAVEMREYSSSSLPAAVLIGGTDRIEQMIAHLRAKIDRFVNRQQYLDSQIRMLQDAEVADRINYLGINNLYESGLKIKTERVKEEMRKSVTMVEQRTSSVYSDEITRGLMMFEQRYTHSDSTAVTCPDAAFSCPNESVTTPKSSSSNPDAPVVSKNNESDLNLIDMPLLLNDKLSPIEGYNFEIPSTNEDYISSRRLLGVSRKKSPRSEAIDAAGGSKKGGALAQDRERLGRIRCMPV